jgi:hypothetical protein
MAHWNEIRDEWRVEQARLCNIPNSEEIVRKFEQTGDEIFWAQFIELMRAEDLKKLQLRCMTLSST